MAAITAYALRNFTRSDWDGFAGCETKNPQLCELPITADEAEGAVLIVDGRLVQLHINNEDGEYYCGDFSSEAEAVKFAVAALASYSALPYDVWFTLIRNVLK